MDRNLKQLVILVLLATLLLEVDLAEIESNPLTRNKRTVISTLSSWWYGDATSTTPAPVDDLPFKDYGVNYVNYPYYTPAGVGSYPIQYIPQQQTYHHNDDDLGRLARELGIRNVRNLPKIEEVMGLLGTSTKDETLQAIREFAATPGGVDMIESFLDTGSEEVKEEPNTQFTHVSHTPAQYNSAPVAVQNIIPSENVQKLPETLKVGYQQPKSLSLSSSTPEQTQAHLEQQKYDSVLNSYQTDMKIVEHMQPEPSGFFNRIGYYASFLNPFGLRQPEEVPLPTEQPLSLTVRPPVYRYPEGYDPHTKKFTDSKKRVELLEEEHKKLSQGPFVHHKQEIQPLIRTPQQNSVVNAPIPAYIYQSGPGNPYFLDQHRLAYPYPHPVQQNYNQRPHNSQSQQNFHQKPQQVPQTPANTFKIDLTNDEYSPNQVEALRKQQQITGQYVSVPLPPITNPAVTNFNGDSGSYNIDVRFGQPINVPDYVASGSEIKETVVEKENEKKIPESTEKPATTEVKTTTESTETLKLIPVQATTVKSEVTTTLATPSEEKTEDKLEHKTENVEEEEIVTVLPDNDFTFETFDAAKELGEKVLESATNSNDVEKTE